ncbi:MAG: GH3 auxin-responsive promoter family protein, partial [Chthoniobacteraceae bacterium]
RCASVSDVCGEKLSEIFVTQAIALACDSLKFSPAFASLAPESDPPGNWNYALLVEGDPPVGLAPRLESKLRANPHYAVCRDLGQLGPLRCQPITRDAYERVCAAGISAGSRMGDIKPRALFPCESREWREWRSGVEAPAGLGSTSPHSSDSRDS